MKKRTIPNGAVHSGSLILVGASHRCPELPGRELTPVGDPADRVLLDRRAALLLDRLMEAIQGWHGILPVSGWRSRGEQREIWEESMAQNGAEFTRKYLAAPGHSEHQTGLAIDLGERREEVDFLCPLFPDSGLCGRFRRLAARYGFILRYPAGKEAVTGIAHEPWHFRYVGAPHALIIEESGWTLEEYIAHLRRRPWGSDPLRYRGHGLDVSVSYLAASDGGVTAWEPPEDGPYSISGNNVDGFIITRWARGW